MTVSTITLAAMRDAARQSERRCYRTLGLTTPNTPEHVEWHGKWCAARAERKLLELLLGNESDAIVARLVAERQYRNDVARVGEVVRV